MMQFANPLPIISYLLTPTSNHAEAAIQTITAQRNLLNAISSVAMIGGFTIGAFSLIPCTIALSSTTLKSERERNLKPYFDTPKVLSEFGSAAKLMACLALFWISVSYSCKAGSALGDRAIHWIQARSIPTLLSL